MEHARLCKKSAEDEGQCLRRYFALWCPLDRGPQTTIAAVVGYKRQGETFGTYSRGPSMEQLRAWVEAVKLPGPPDTATRGSPHQLGAQGGTSPALEDPPHLLRQASARKVKPGKRKEPLTSEAHSERRD